MVLAVDIEMHLASVEEGQPLHCESLSRPPMSSEIEDNLSPLFCDIAHAIQRLYVPTKHEAKKRYSAALKNAFSVWNESQTNELIDKMTDATVLGGEVDKINYDNPRILFGCIEGKEPSPSVLYWRVRAVFELYGKMEDSVTGKPLFNAKAWKNANEILCDIRNGYYSNYPGTDLVMGDGNRGIATVEIIEN